MARENIAHLETLLKKIEEADVDLLRGLMHETIQMLMGAEADSPIHVSTPPSALPGAGGCRSARELHMSGSDRVGPAAVKQPASA